MNRKHLGTRFEDFLEDEGLRAEVDAAALKRAAALRMKALMRSGGVSKAALARRMGTSRPQLDRLLEPNDETSVTLRTLSQAATALGAHLTLRIDSPRATARRSRGCRTNDSKLRR